MSTGLFIHRGVGQGRAFQKARRERRPARYIGTRASADNARAVQSRAAASRLADFAEALSVEFTIAEASELVGVTLCTGQRYFRTICADVEAAGLMRCE